MLITVEELKNHLEKCLSIAEKEDILITRNGKTLAVVSSQNRNKVNIAMSLFGIISTDISLEEVIEERLNSI